MSKHINVLGDIRAECDREMLESAFYETPDYRTLIESTDRPIVVGRRGTGKSALCYELKKYWTKGTNTILVEIIPEEDQVIGIQQLLRLFGDKYTQIKAGARIAWKYALLMEIATRLFEQKRLSQSETPPLLTRHVAAWRSKGRSVASRLRELLRTKGQLLDSPQATIAGLAQGVDLADLQDALVSALAKTRVSFVFLIDQLDEGFEPDELGVGLIGGFGHMLLSILNSQINQVKVYIFLPESGVKAHRMQCFSPMFMGFLLTFCASTLTSLLVK